MNLKTYQAYSMGEVLTRIRKDLGEQAVVVHTRTFRRGGILGIGARIIYEVTASGSPQVAPTTGVQARVQPKPLPRAALKQSNGLAPGLLRNVNLIDPQQRGFEAEQSILEHILHQPTPPRRGTKKQSASGPPPTSPTNGVKIRSAALGTPSNPTPTSADQLLASLSLLGQQSDIRQNTAKSASATTRLGTKSSAKPLAPAPPSVPAKLHGIQNETECTAQNPARPISRGDRTLRNNQATKDEQRSSPTRVAKRFLIDPQTGRAVAAPERTSRTVKPIPAQTANRAATPFTASSFPTTDTPKKITPVNVMATGSVLTADKVVEATNSTTPPSAKKKTARKSMPKKSARKRAATKKSARKKTTRKTTTEKARAGKKSKAIAPSAMPTSSESIDPMRAELAALRELVTQVVKQQQEQTAPAVDAGASGDPHVHAALTKHYAELIEHEVAEELANDICQLIQSEFSGTDLHDDEAVRARVLDHLMEYIPVVESAVLDGPRIQADGRPLTMALVGPTGVGKTTTIAKLAASFKLRDQLTVGLITTDTYRIAAVDQLRTYAEIIGVPLKVALTPAELASACHALRDVDVILIDTAGRSPNDSERIDEIRSFIGAADPHETHLVLSSASSEQVMLRTIERFSTVQADHMIFTKLDEAVNFGVIVNVMRKVGKKLSFITTGQEVPDQIERGEAGRLARLILGENLHA